MSYEFRGFANPREDGAIVISTDTCGPRVTIHDGSNFLVECRANCDASNEIRSGQGWIPNSFEILRGIDKAGELVDWSFIMLPILSSETKGLIEELGSNLNIRPHGKGRTAVLREIGAKLPRIVMDMKSSGVIVKVPGLAELKINDNNIAFSEKSGGYDHLTSQLSNDEPYISFDLPLEPASFFPEEIRDPRKYFIKSRVKLLRGIDQKLKASIHDIIQNGTYTENRLRSLVSVSFSIDTYYEEEAYSIA